MTKILEVNTLIGSIAYSKLQPAFAYSLIYISYISTHRMPFEMNLGVAQNNNSNIKKQLNY